MKNFISKTEAFPELPLAKWKDTKNTLHLYLQIVGKIRLSTHPPLNHWWNVPFYVTPFGLTTSTIPYGFGSFEIEFDLINHKLKIRTSKGEDRENPKKVKQYLTRRNFPGSRFGKKLTENGKLQLLPLPEKQAMIINS